MEIAGIELGRDLVIELAELLTHTGAPATASYILKADAADFEAMSLTVVDLHAVRRALNPCPSALAELRSAVEAALDQA